MQSIFIVNATEKSKWLKYEPISPIPEVTGLDEKKITLGKRLFNDKNLSVNGTISCNTCHNLLNYGVDSLPKSIGTNGLLNKRNSPTVLNSGLLFSLSWDGRHQSLEEQVSAPLLSPNEMASNWKKVISYLSNDPYYKKVFKDSYDHLPSKENISHAIAEFERSLLTPNAPFDLFLKGDLNAIDSNTKKGYQLFKSYGCVSCHQGVAIGGNLYEKLGISIPYFNESTDKKIDLGRYEITGVESHKFKFKVPSLRNIVKTAPYLHDGSIATLPEVVDIMAKYQLGIDLSKQENMYIVMFLESLSGVINGKK